MNAIGWIHPGELEAIIASIHELLEEDPDAVDIMNRVERDADRARTILDAMIETASNDDLLRIVSGSRFDVFGTHIRARMNDERRKAFDQSLIKRKPSTCRDDHTLIVLGFGDPTSLQRQIVRLAYPFSSQSIYKNAIPAFWTHHIRKSVNDHKWVDAWKNLRTALNGFVLEQGIPREVSLRRFVHETMRLRDMPDRFFFLDGQQQRMDMVRLVFDAIAKERLLAPVVGEEFAHWSHERDYCREMSLPYPSQSSEWAHVPGAIEARYFVLRLSQDVMPGDPLYMTRERMVVTPEGAMILKIARYATELEKLKNTSKRSQKIEKE